MHEELQKGSYKLQSDFPQKNWILNIDPKLFKYTLYIYIIFCGYRIEALDTCCRLFKYYPSLTGQTAYQTLTDIDSMYRH